MTWVMILFTTCITCLTHTAQSQKWRESVSFCICHEVTLTGFLYHHMLGYVGPHPEWSLQREFSSFPCCHLFNTACQCHIQHPHIHHIFLIPCFATCSCLLLPIPPPSILLLLLLVLLLLINYCNNKHYVTLVSLAGTVWFEHLHQVHVCLMLSRFKMFPKSRLFCLVNVL